MEEYQMDRMALEAALEQARKSEREGGIPIGAALLTPEGAVVSLGHNRRLQRGDTTAHAEIECLRSAGRRDDWPRLTLATTLSPCALCAGAVVLHRLRRVVIGESRNFQGREEWLREAGVEVVVLDDPRCVAILRRFIESHRGVWGEDIGERLCDGRAGGG